MPSAPTQSTKSTPDHQPKNSSPSMIDGTQPRRQPPPRRPGLPPPRPSASMTPCCRKRDPLRRATAVNGDDLPRTPSAATKLTPADLRAHIEQDGPPSCSGPPVLRRSVSATAPGRVSGADDRSMFLLQRLQRLRGAIRRELRPRAGIRSVLRLHSQRRDPRNNAVVRQWIPPKIAARAQRYYAVLQRAN